MAFGRARALVLLTLSHAAFAERIAIAPPRVTGTDGAITTNLRASLAGGAAASGAEVVPAREVDDAIARAPALGTCHTEVCAQRLGELVAARAVVRAAVEVLGRSHYSFRVEIVEVTPGRVVAAVEDACPACTLREANEALSRAAATLVGRLTPSTAPPPAAAPTVLAPTPPPARPWPARSRAYLGLGVTAFVLAAGALGGGAALIALDDSRVTTDPASDPMSHRTGLVLPGALLCAAAGVLAIGGGLFVWRATVARRAIGH